MVALGITSLQITHKKTGKNRKEPATKKPVNTRFYRLLNFLTFVSAERAGFEPAIPFRVYTLSRRAPSTTRTPLLLNTARGRKPYPSRGAQKYNIAPYLPNNFSAFAVVTAATSSTETPFTSASRSTTYRRYAGSFRFPR
jgi:hypothetical protein